MSLPKKKNAAGSAATRPAPPPAPLVPLSGAASWVYTIGFSLAVVSFIIGIYQTMVERDLASNYWLFMISLSFLFGLRWWRVRQSGAAARRTPDAPVTPPSAKSGAKSAKK